MLSGNKPTTRTAPAPPPPTPPPSAPRPHSPQPSPDVASDGDGPDQPQWSPRKLGSRTSKWNERMQSGRLVYGRFDHLGAAGLKIHRGQSRYHPYNTPLGDHGEPLSIDIKIAGPGKKKLLENPVGSCGAQTHILSTIHPPGRQQSF